MFKILSAEHEIYCTEEAEACPYEVPFEWLTHIYHSKWDEYTKSDNLLNDFELWQGIDSDTYTIGWHHNHIFAQCNAPTYKSGDIPCFRTHIFQMTIPRKGHKTVAQYEHQYRNNVRRKDFCYHNKKSIVNSLWSTIFS